MLERDEDRPMIWVMLGIVVGSLIGWWVHRNRREIQSAVMPEQCPYMFDRSGQCIRPNHHKGRHY